MKKTFFTTLFFLLAILANAQDKMSTKTGKVSFEASVPSFEEVKGTNEAVTCVLNVKTGEIASLALMKGFRFKIALMEEHFNENYVESGKYPKATFRGKIENFDAASLTSTPKDFVIKGKLEMHGKTREISAPAKIRKTDSGIEIVTDFVVNTDDFAISIPSVVKSKVSKTVNIHSVFVVN